METTNRKQETLVRTTPIKAEGHFSFERQTHNLRVYKGCIEPHSLFKPYAASEEHVDADYLVELWQRHFQSANDEYFGGRRQLQQQSEVAFQDGFVTYLGQQTKEELPFLGWEQGHNRSLHLGQMVRKVLYEEHTSKRSLAHTLHHSFATDFPVQAQTTANARKTESQT